MYITGNNYDNRLIKIKLNYENMIRDLRLLVFGEL